jgi:deazaflavin-dependent oxidoreductase (nitroreductase family)
MRPMTRALNPLILKAAGRRHVRAAAQIHHRGRKSGTLYSTPVSAHRVGDQFLIPLTFGTDSDWARNVRAAGECEIRWRGEDHVAAAPEVVKATDIKPLMRTAFRPHERMMFKALGITHVMCLRIAGDA